MRILMMSKGGDGLGVAQRLAFEGNDVDLWIQDERYHRAGRGLVNRVGDWQRHLRTADLVLCDCVGYGRFEEQIRSSDKPYLGFNGMVDRIERDRQTGMEMFRRAGLTIPETHPFASREAARQLPSEHGWGSGWVIKSDTGNVQDTRVVRERELWQHAVAKLPDKARGIVQRAVDGIEVSTEGWFNGSDWVMPFNHTFEEKRFMSGGVGCNTGCQGNVVINAKRGNRLTRATVEPMGDLLRMIDYRGPFDVNAIVTEGDAYALEATSRMGFDAIEALIEGLDEPTADMLIGVANGTSKSMLLTDDVMIAVRVSIPPHPFRNPNADDYGEPIAGITDQKLHHLFLCDVYRDDEGYKTAGAEGLLYKATAIGRVERHKRSADGDNYKPDYTYEARRRVYRLIRSITADGQQYRDDIGERVNKDIDQLKRWGWLSADT